ncbi:30S ribosomal protein S12 methylthiotransferase RimO [Aquella oligotrophica]|uniref:Ribosomal protein uS12 methylthiotransferase RimO n=1 Tax=Aquella oligotrophica TaxID=2067065 RepID=A0A2I7N3N1_9NEIS|nr:30S ribosomal protein S12 methylthiotransferase RimO [Aquella oligotrophica]AUR51052.1 30S ribosomal protein S12 methylthiotransferase RimO [Aquella oligotrophica]
MARIGFVSLGCPKALVDSENILTSLKAEGYDIVNSYENADLVVVNTCGFIDSAVEESMNAIGEALNENGKVVVTGCLGAKEGIIETQYPNVLGVTGPHATQEVLNLIHKYVPRPHDPFTDLVPPQGVKLTPKHYAYLKISEGCNNTCTFCIIPTMRGKLDSYPIGDVLSQAEKLVAAGVKELLVVSQDTGAYGVDKKYITGFYNGKPVKTKFLDLCKELSNLGVWVRLHYVYPYPHIDEVIPLMAEGKLLPYLDIPFQHASPKVLKAMKRPGNVDGLLERIAAWRTVCPELAIRSTFIVGFPGETEEDFQMLLDFLDKAQLEKVGCFKYSEVEGAPANQLESHVPEEVKEDRYQRFMQHQQKISFGKLQAKVGQIMPMIIDEVSRKLITGRSKYDAPEIDGLIYIKNLGQYPDIQPGDIIDVEILAAQDYDLFAKPV